MPYRFAYSTNAYTNWPLERAIHDIRTRGFDGIEILADLPHAYPLSFDSESLRKTLAGFPISNLNANTSLGLDPEKRDPHGFWPSMLNPDPNTRQLKIDYVKNVIDLARTLGAPAVCTATGRAPTDLSSLTAHALCRNAFEELLAHAERKPTVLIGVEYEPGFLVGGRDSALELLSELDHPLMGVNLDLGHAECEREDLAKTIEAFGQRIWNIHLEDIRAHVHEHLIPGEGDIDFSRIRRSLDRIHYDRFITLELYPYKNDPGGAGSRALNSLRSFFA